MAEETWGRVATLDLRDRRDSELLDQIMREAGQRVGAPKADPVYLSRVARAQRFLNEVKAGRISQYWLQETLTTSDFPLLFGDILTRQLLGNYTAWEPNWKNYTKQLAPAPDFRDIRLLTFGGLDDRWYPAYGKPEMTGVQEKNNLAETGQLYHVDVYERAFSFNWRMLINDSLNVFGGNLPDRLAAGARKSEDFFTTTLFVDANGPHASFYTGGNKNIINVANGAASNNPALSINGLQDAYTVLSKMTDPVTGEPIVIESVELVVPPALRITAENLMNATTLFIGGFGQVAAGGVAGQQLQVNNWMRGMTRVTVNPYIPVVASVANGSSSWFLFANPDRNRPAIGFGYLQGWEGPRIYRRAPNMERVGGGVEPMMGDFETGEIKHKGVHVFGGLRIDPRATVASSGAGV